MRIRSLFAILLIAALALTLTACVGKLPVEDLIPGTGEAPISTAPATTAAPEPAIPAVKGADSVKTLVEKSLEYYHTGDYSAVADVHNRQAYLAWFLMEDVYRDEKLSFDQALEKAALLFEDAETLRAADPELADLILEECDVEDRQEFVNDFMEELRDDYQEGALTEDEPDAERVAQMLEDWDKGAAYMFEHYPELTEYAEKHWIAFDLESALKLMQNYSRFDLNKRELERFRELDCEYSPDKISVRNDGISEFDLGSVVEGSDVWSVSMLYCYRDDAYYLIGYSYVLGSLGG